MNTTKCQTKCTYKNIACVLFLWNYLCVIKKKSSVRCDFSSTISATTIIKKHKVYMIELILMFILR